MILLSHVRCLFRACSLSQSLVSYSPPEFLINENGAFLLFHMKIIAFCFPFSNYSICSFKISLTLECFLVFVKHT